MARVTFVNDAADLAQVTVTVNDLGFANFQIARGRYDSRTVANNGDIVWFWWRNDGQPCSMCGESDAPCSRNEIEIGDDDVSIQLASCPMQTI
jgi:hypothetical protein